MSDEGIAKLFPPTEEHRKGALITSEEEYKRIYDESIKDPEGFWSKMADSIEWFSKDWDSVLEFDEEDVRISWFKGGKLNITHNCIDRHVNHGKKNQAALIWQGEEDDDVKVYTYGQLLYEVSRAANMLKAKGVGKGDRVSIYLPMIPELAFSVLACARIGAIHSVVFGGFSSDALYNRITDCDSKVLITSDGSFRGGKAVDLKGKANEALEAGTTVETVIVVKRTGADVVMEEGRDCWYHEEIADAAPHCEPEAMDAEDPLFILYTSGSTGKPKGVLHTTGGYNLYTTVTFEHVFGYLPGEVFWCTADIGWITGHSYILYGPLSAGATTLMFEGVPNYPQPDRFWQVAEKWKVNVFYTAPTAVRMMRKTGDEWVKMHDLSSIRLLGSVGEPIDPEAWYWYYDVVGNKRSPVVDTWWQTETGGIMISPLPGATTLKPGCATKPFFGIEPMTIREDRSACDVGENGRLVIKKPWPSIMRTLWGDHQRFKDTYWNVYPGYYFTGDGGRIDEDGDVWILGRVDDVMSVAGHRIGAAEVEAALTGHPSVAEAAVVPVPDDIKGEAIYVFVNLKEGYEGSDELRKELVGQVRHDVGPIATPKLIQFAEGLPKTRSGKIMRRILRKIAGGGMHEDLGDVSTLADPDVVDQLIAGRIV